MEMYERFEKHGGGNVYIKVSSIIAVYASDNDGNPACVHCDGGSWVVDSTVDEVICRIAPNGG